MPVLLNIIRVCFHRKGRLICFQAMGCYLQVMLEDTVRHWLARVFALRFTLDKWQVVLLPKLSRLEIPRLYFLDALINSGVRGSVVTWTLLTCLISAYPIIAMNNGIMRLT